MARINQYAVNYVIDVWKADGYMEQLVAYIGYVDKETAIERAKQHLKESGLDYVKAHINLMYYNLSLYNYKTEHIWIEKL